MKPLALASALALALVGCTPTPGSDAGTGDAGTLADGSSDGGSPRECSAGETRCAGDAVETCGANGQWSTPMSCTSQACVGGMCTGHCSPGARQCSGNGVQTCGSDGNWSQPVACVNQACVSGTCTGSCAPGATQCLNNGVQTCGSDGNWSQPVACVNQACVSGACVGLCAPGATQCTEAVGTQTCGSDGQWSAPLTTPVVNMIWVQGSAVNLDGVTPNVVDGSIDNTIQAFWTDPRHCTANDPSPTFHWVINTPNTPGYTAWGISGYRTDTLTVLGDSIPNFVPQTIVVTFTITHPPVAGVDPSTLTTTVRFRMSYRNSALTVGMSVTCQSMQMVGAGCDIQAALAVPLGTPT